MPDDENAKVFDRNDFKDVCPWYRIKTRFKIMIAVRPFAYDV